MARVRGRLGPERGSVAIEAAILVPVFIVLVTMVIMVGRIRTVDGAVVEAARDAARAGSTASSPDTAVLRGQAAGEDTLRSSGLSCPDPVVVRPRLDGALGVDTVQATVTCQVSLADLLWRGVPGSIKITSSFTAVVDAYRAN
jgi:Flp pilus assembly protein TadG